jgi:hypothetical protein
VAKHVVNPVAPVVEVLDVGGTAVDGGEDVDVEPDGGAVVDVDDEGVVEEHAANPHARATPPMTGSAERTGRHRRHPGRAGRDTPGRRVTTRSLRA